MKYMPEQQRQQPTVAERYRDAGDEPAAEPQQAATEWSTAPASVGGGPERTSSLARMVSPPPPSAHTNKTYARPSSGFSCGMLCEHAQREARAMAGQMGGGAHRRAARGGGEIVRAATGPSSVVAAPKGAAMVNDCVSAGCRSSRGSRPRAAAAAARGGRQLPRPGRRCKRFRAA
jgi:hypothetical protein